MAEKEKGCNRRTERERAKNRRKSESGDKAPERKGGGEPNMSPASLGFHIRLERDFDMFNFRSLVRMTHSHVMLVVIINEMCYYCQI